MKRKKEEDKGKQACQSEDDRSIAVRIDPNILNCSICSKPLQLPVLQCKNGHITCSKCSGKVENKCSRCGCSLEDCPGIVPIINSITVSCPNSSFGCKETILYINQHSHQEFCPYAPCSCPMPDCTFKGPVPELSAHISSRHRTICRQQDSELADSWRVTIPREKPFIVLKGMDGELFLLLNGHDIPSGYSLSFCRIGPSLKEENVNYVLKAYTSSPKTESSLCLDAPLINIKEWKGAYPTKNFLFIPSEFRSRSSVIVFVHIKK